MNNYLKYVPSAGEASMFVKKPTKSPEHHIQWHEPLKTVEEIKTHLETITDDALTFFYALLDGYIPRQIYAPHITMRMYARVVYAEMDRRGMPYSDNPRKGKTNDLVR